MNSTFRSERGYSKMPQGQAHWRRAGEPGTANSLICLHMMPKSSRSFDAILPMLAKNRLVVAPDFPGYGASDSLSEPASITTYARWLWALIDALDLTPPIDLLGYHTGSMVAVAAARQRPQSVGRIINLSTPIFSDNELLEIRRFFEPTPLDEAGTRFKLMWERILQFRGPGMSLEMAAQSLSDNLLGGEDYEEGHRAAFDYAAQYLLDLKTIEQEVLVMNIADDLQANTRRVDPYLNNGRRQEHPKWGNGLLELHSEDFAAAVLEFLDGDAPTSL